MAKKTSQSDKQKMTNKKKLEDYERAREAYTRHMRGGSAYASNVRIGGEKYADDITHNFKAHLERKATEAGIKISS